MLSDLGYFSFVFFLSFSFTIKPINRPNCYVAQHNFITYTHFDAMRSNFLKLYHGSMLQQEIKTFAKYKNTSDYFNSFCWNNGNCFGVLARLLGFVRTTGYYEKHVI